MVVRLLALATAATIVCGCNIDGMTSLSLGPVTKGKGPVVAEPRAVGDFSELEVGSAFQVEVKVGPATSVKVEAQENLLKKISTVVHGKRLKVHIDGGIETDKPLKLTVTTPKLTALDLSGACIGKLEGVKSPDFSVELSGASKLKAKGDISTLKFDGSGACDFVWSGLHAKKATLGGSGASNILLDGSVDELSADLSGATGLHAERLEVMKASISASGASTASVKVLESLMAEASGGSSVRYSGNPQVTQSASGGGQVSKSP